MSAKQDKTFPRTASALEQKYKFGKSFAEAIGIAEDARDKAEEASEAVKGLDKDLTAEEIYNRLTNNGTVQGLFRAENGDLFVNAAYIVALEELFAKNILMSGKFTCTTETFLEPGIEECQTIVDHILGKKIIPINEIPLYDFDGNGDITGTDLVRAKFYNLGKDTIANWSGAVKSTVTMTIDMSNPDKAIRLTGTNMWGREIERYIGINFSNIQNSADYIVETNTSGSVTYEKWASGKAVCIGKENYGSVPCTNAWHGWYETNSLTLNLPEDFFIEAPQHLDLRLLYGGAVGDIQHGSIAPTKSKITFAIKRPTSLTFTDCTVSFHIVGRWK